MGGMAMGGMGMGGGMGGGMMGGMPPMPGGVNPVQLLMEGCPGLLQECGLIGADGMPNMANPQQSIQCIIGAAQSIQTSSDPADADCASALNALAPPHHRPRRDYDRPLRTHRPILRHHRP